MADEIFYIDTDADRIWQAMLMAYMQNGGDVLYPGNEKEMLLRGVLAMIVQTAANVDNALKMDTLRFAVRDYLDLYGEKRGCYRISAKPAGAMVTLQLTTDGASKYIPAGTQMTHDGVVLYALDDDVRANADVLQVTVHVTCTETGTGGNNLTEGTEMQLMNYQNLVNRAVVATMENTGRDAEDDESYRERIRLYGLGSVTTGPSARYEAAAKEVSKDIIDAKAVMTAPGTVTVYLLIGTEDGTEGIIRGVGTALDDEKTRPLTDLVHIAAAEKVGYRIFVKYNAGSENEADIMKAIREYKEWQESRIGRAFNPDMLMSKLYQAGASRVQWGEGCTFDGGAFGYHELSAGQYCSGEIYPAVM